jgi:Uma2 family endonuclease
MRTLLPDPPPADFEELLERRRHAGADRLDEVWQGVYHMVPAPSHADASIAWQLAVVLTPSARDAGLEPTGEFNLGESEHDYRVPDGGLHRPGAGGTWHPTAALVVEIVSPGDESWEKLPFYAAHLVDEVLIVDLRQRSVSWLARERAEYRSVERSGLIALGPSELHELLDWPPADAEPGGHATPARNL